MNIHLIGAGGAGLSALGNLYLDKGYQVSGSDSEAKSRYVDQLLKGGFELQDYNDVENISTDLDLVVYSNAIPKNDPDNAELAKAKELGIKTLAYPEALGEITREFTTVAIAGTHGKTTTTAMVLHILTSAGISPTGILGSLLSSSGSNYVKGDSNILVIEADEYMKAFLNHSPSVVGVTNIDHDHHDIYPTLDDMKDTFRQLGDNLPEIGTLICSALDQNSWDTYDDLARNIVDYSAVDISDLDLKVPGAFNRQNAQLAIAIAEIMGVDGAAAMAALKTFSGTWRRQEYKGKTSAGQLVYDDYAHHPTEIRASLSGFRELFPDKKITVIFQPHLYSRTRELFDEFVEVFVGSSVDQIILVPVYAAREVIDESVSSKVLVNTICEQRKGVVFASSMNESMSLIADSSKIVITMGAGDITNLSDNLIKN